MTSEENYLKRLCEATERIADHLTKQGMGVVPGGQKPKAHYNQQPEQINVERHGQRPKAASRS